MVRVCRTFSLLVTNYCRKNVQVRWRELKRLQVTFRVTVERQLYWLSPVKKRWGFTLQPVTTIRLTAMRCISMKLRLPASRMQFCAMVRWNTVSCLGATLSAQAWAFQSINPTPRNRGNCWKKARNEMGELAYVPAGNLTGTVTFRHLLRLQKGQFVLPPARYVRSYAPAQQVLRQG